MYDDASYKQDEASYTKEEGSSAERGGEGPFIKKVSLGKERPRWLPSRRALMLILHVVVHLGWPPLPSRLLVMLN